MAYSVKLRILVGPREIRAVVFHGKDSFLFGRSSQCNCSIPDEALSAEHCRLEVDPPDCLLKDLGSHNGTFVNGARCGGTPVALKHGDVIRAGRTEITVAVETTLGPYVGVSIPNVRVIREIGAGGMGMVYLARWTRDTGETADVALKIIDLEGRGHPADPVTLFRREETVLRSLKHPNIVALLDSGNCGKVFYYTMEYCNADSVAQLMRQSGGRLPLAKAAPLMLQALDGLSYAHSRGIVHRDLKPGNILLHDERGRFTAKLADFGIAKNFAFAGQSGVTRVGVVGGTFEYMDRAQLNDYIHVKPTSDVFAVGATFYSMLTGAFVYDFGSQDPVSVIDQGEIVPIRRRGVELPDELCDLIDKAIAVEPVQRFESAGKMRESLGRVLDNLPSQT